MLLWVASRNLRVRVLATFLVALVVGLATATALVVPLVLRQVERGASDAVQVFDLLIAAKGSPSQALLSSLFYLEAPIGNLPHSLLERLKADPRTAHAIPLGFGDNYQGLPIVGTSTEFFSQTVKPGEPYFRLRTGRLFQRSFEAVLGARAARESGLGIGESFTTAHGHGPSDAEHSETYAVVGIMAPTGGPADRAVLVDLASLWEVHGQEHADDRQVTAIIYRARSLAGVYAVAQSINAGSTAQAIFPGVVFAQFRNLLMGGREAYAWLSFLVLVLAALTVWLSVYAGALERRQHVALLRALGAGRPLVFGLVLAETLLTVAVGLILGVILAYGASWAAAVVLGEYLGFAVPRAEFDAGLALRVVALLPLGLLAALPPALQAARQSPVAHL